jgi:hypothetical protein
MRGSRLFDRETRGYLLRVFSILILSVLSIAGCNSNPDVVPIQAPLEGTPPNDTWVATDPIQCLGNPWEQDWLESHNGDTASYPGDPLTPELDPAEMEIITDYFESQGVKIIGGETAGMDDNVCLSCACPLGYTLFLLVPGDDVQAMLDLGFRLETP